MPHCGTYPGFDLAAVRTYPLRTRRSKVHLGEFADNAGLAAAPVVCTRAPWYRNGRRGGGADQSRGLRAVAAHAVQCRREGKPVVLLSGAHPVKDGLAPLIVDLIARGFLTLFATNGAGSIHSFELALTGASSKNVRAALPTGEFGMAFETGAYINHALRIGQRRGYGYGECMGRLFCDRAFRKVVLDAALRGQRRRAAYLRPYDGFAHTASCIFAAAYQAGIPACVMSSIGSDIIDQHPSFDGGAKGAASGRDFLIFAEEIARLTRGGVVLNLGSAIMGPEALLKAASMAANTGRPPNGLWTADFDLRPFGGDKGRDERCHEYYYRDQKSVVTRIPESFCGVGFYFQGLHRETFVPFYQYVLQALG